MDQEDEDEVTGADVGEERLSRDLGGRLAYRPAELASSVGLSAKAVYRAIARGELGAVRVANGRRLLIPVECAREWLAAERVAPPGLPEIPADSRRSDEARPLRSALASLK